MSVQVVTTKNIMVLKTRKSSWRSHTQLIRNLSCQNLYANVTGSTSKHLVSFRDLYFHVCWRFDYVTNGRNSVIIIRWRLSERDSTFSSKWLSLEVASQTCRFGSRQDQPAFQVLEKLVYSWIEGNHWSWVCNKDSQFG